MKPLAPQKTRHIIFSYFLKNFSVNPKEIKVTLGEHDRDSKNESSPVIMRKIKRVLKHPDFSLSNFNNDIAMLELVSGVDFEAPQIHPACLPEHS